ncbi:MAG: nitroreductase/quinone reductase family protein, partial [Ktedonobacterales bacterium]
MSSEPQTAGAIFARISRVPSIARAATGSHVFLYRLTSGALGGRLLNAPVMLVTTTGRKTGKQRTTPVVYLPDGDRFIVIASNGGQGKLPNWWLNMRA